MGSLLQDEVSLYLTTKLLEDYYVHYVYILKNRNSIDDFYLGCTSNLEKRLKKHNAGLVESTRGKQWEIVYYEAYLNQNYAFVREMTLKRNRRIKNFLLERIKESLSEDFL